MTPHREKAEGHDRFVRHMPCPACGSKDANSLYGDGHTHCFSCGSSTYPDAGERRGFIPPEGTRKGNLLSPEGNPQAWADLPKRNLKTDTLRAFGYFQAIFKGEPCQVAPYFDQEGHLAHQKVRGPNKAFSVLKASDDGPTLTDCKLFGQQHFGDRFDKRVVVTEGELDALSVAQAVDFKCAVVSVGGGSQGAAKHLRANYRWLDRFDEIVLWFDDDEPGRTAMEECAKLFQVGKVRIARAPDGLKDASDLLQASRSGDVMTAIYAATAWRPQGIVNGKDMRRAIMAPTEAVLSFSYPPAMTKLQEMTGGIVKGDVIYHVAGTGVGKSAVLREIQYHLAVTQKVKIAVLSFEDATRDAMLGIMSVHANERLHLRPLPDPTDRELLKAYDEALAAVWQPVFGTGNIELFDPESAEWSMDAIMGYVRYCAKALDCEVVFIDPLSFVVAGLEITADERRVLDRVAAEFAKMAKELDIHIQVSHHLRRTQGIPHEEGAPTSLNELRSSGGLANFAMGVIGWERNQQASGEAWRVTQARILKPIRRTGKSGLADTLYYDDRGRLIPSPLPMPPPGKPQDGDGDGGYEAVSPHHDY